MPPPVSHLYSSTSDAGQASHSMTSTFPTQSSPCPPALSSPNMSCGLSTNPAGDQRTSVPSRPKLTLQTRCLPKTTGTSSTGLSFSFVSGAAASPTVRNTFKNAYDVPLPSSATTSPSKSSSKPSRPIQSYAVSNNNGPYQIPLGVKSILRNSPLEPCPRRLSMSIAATGSNGGSAPRRVFFPAKKQVNYRYPLEEEIQTVHYTARHSDLIGEPEPAPSNDNGSDNDSDSNSSWEQSDTGGSDEDTGAEGSSLGKLERKKRKQLSAQRQIRAVALLDGLEQTPYAASTPQTPQDRVKRRREWKWTLGPIEARNETFGFPQTPTKPNVNGPQLTLGPGSETRSAEKETESSISCDSDLTSFSAASRPYSSPNSSLASPENSDDSKTNTIDNEHRI